MPTASMFTARALAEGKWPILGFAALTVAAMFLNRGVFWYWFLTGLAAALLAFTIAFFRDPERAVPADPQAIVAPGDGRIVAIKSTGAGTMVAIFLSVFDVHVQRAPIAGAITRVQYHAGQFLDARHPDASSQNENRVIEIETADGLRVTVKQIAGLIARRIVGWAGTGAQLQTGERLGMIKFGSRVELTLPAGVEVVARVGDYAKGGETIVARRK